VDLKGSTIFDKHRGLSCPALCEVIILALFGWFIFLPPISSSGGLEIDAPTPKWERILEFRSQQECVSFLAYTANTPSSTETKEKERFYEGVLRRFANGRLSPEATRQRAAAGKCLWVPQ
jgi:hypothetical protein